MIPKTIHYAWFGPKEMPADMMRLIDGWRKVMPDYEFILWNESNFDVSYTPYLREAYASGNFAFVVDVVRFNVLYRYGGIYLDTDIEVIKSFDPYIGTTGFLGYETAAIGTGVIGAPPRARWIKACLDYYESRHFINICGKTLRRPSPRVLTAVTAPYIGKEVTAYPIDCFCAKDWRTGAIRVTDNTVCIHHYADTWRKKRLSPWGKVVKLLRGLATRYDCRSAASFLALPCAAKCRGCTPRR